MRPRVTIRTSRSKSPGDCVVDVIRNLGEIDVRCLWRRMQVPGRDTTVPPLARYAPQVRQWYTFPPRQPSNTMDAPVKQPLRSLPLTTRRIDIQNYFTALTGRGADTPTTIVVDTTRRELSR